MRSAIFYGRHNIQVKDTPIPELGAEDVLIEVRVCGICGTDVHIYEGDPGAANVLPPTILGHEFAGIVKKLGYGVKNFSIGDRVCVDPNQYCGSCYFCRNGLSHYCTNMIGYGTTVNGGFSQYCRVNQRQVYLLGTNTSFEQGAMAEPAACCLHGIDMCDIHPGHNVVVIGGGMIGLLMVQLAKLSGASKVALLEPVAKKRDMGHSLGADIAIDPLCENVREQLKQANMQYIHTVIECVGNPSTIEQAIDLVGNRGTVMMFGLTKPEAEISVRPFEVFRKELTLKSSYINPYTHQRALDLIDSGRLDVSSMICEICSLEQLAQILREPSLRAEGKYLIAPNQ